MDLKDRNATILAVRKDGEFVDIEFTRDDGQRVMATFCPTIWKRAPVALAKKVTEAFSGGLPIDRYRGRKIQRQDGEKP